MTRFIFRQSIGYLSLLIIILSNPIRNSHATTIQLPAALNSPGLVIAQGLNDTTIQLTFN